MLLIFWDSKGKYSVRNKIDSKLKFIYGKLVGEFSNDSRAKVIFTSSKNIRNLNKTYRKIDKETDVLSFAELDTNKNLPKILEEKSLGEIYINYDWIRANKNLIKSASRLFLHGYLHLLGYDHEKDRGEMAKVEKKLSSETLDKL